MLVEANALSEGLADAEWVATWFGLCKDINYDMKRRDSLNRQIQINAITSTEGSDGLSLAAVTDAKSLIDNMSRE